MSKLSATISFEDYDIIAEGLNHIEEVMEDRGLSQSEMSDIAAKIESATRALKAAIEVDD